MADTVDAASAMLARDPRSGAGAAWIAPIAVAVGIPALAVWFFAKRGWLYYFGDAEAHLNIARRLLDNATPGWDQLGSPWLPLPHLLIAPFAAIDPLWRDGFAGSIPAAACFIAAALFLFSAVREIFRSDWSAWAAMLVFLFNPNALYLQSTAMTEAFFAAALCGLLYFTARFRRSQSATDVFGAALCAVAGTWIRYDGWILLPFCAVYFLITAHRRWSRTALFCAVAGMGPLLWFFYNWWLTGNPLDFYNGPNSAKAIQGSAFYPGSQNWYLARVYYRTCVQLVIGMPLYWIAVAGFILAILKRKYWPALLLALPPLFYVWSMHSSGGTPIHVPELWPYSWYNTRYGLAALPLAAFCAAAMTRSRWAFLFVAIAVFPWLGILHGGPSHRSWITWKESEQNSISRRAWTAQAADYLSPRVHPHERVAAEFNDTMGVFRYAGIPLKQVFHPGNGLLWEAAAQQPLRFLDTDWIVCQRAEWSRLSTAARQSKQYILVRTVAVPGAPPLDIYHHHADPLHQSARREE